MKADFAYRCSDCGELLTHVTQGACSVCGSHSVLPLGWFEISLRERQDWLERIHGLRKRSRLRENRLSPQDERQSAEK
jgi:hypothetical protein